MAEYLPQVREQYEQYPYPPRNPDDDQKWLVTTCLDDLAMINHYCYAGRQDFKGKFRVLVAGGGTGDATIFLAHQLRNTDAQIVHLDLSAASIDIARRRADIRSLDNITWINDSILSLPALGVGTFDYINCVGVLHHMENPDAGLRALLAVLKPAGALGVMVYGKYGRTGVYQMQSLMRLINQREPDIKKKIANTKDVLESLPPTNWFQRAENLIIDHKKYGDTGIYDIFLHGCDRAYTVGELYDWLEGEHGLHLEFSSNMRGRSVYQPELVVGQKEPRRFLDSVRTLPLRQQQEIAELIIGNLITHTFFITQSPQTRAVYGGPDHVPFFSVDSTALDLLKTIRRNKGQPLVISYAQNEISASVNPGSFGELILQHIDGKKHFGEIFSLVRAAPEVGGRAVTDEELFRDFRSAFEFLSSVDRLLLRHRGTDPVA